MLQGLRRPETIYLRNIGHMNQEFSNFCLINTPRDLICNDISL